MMGITGEPNSYHPTDGNGVAVQSQPPMACVCRVVPAQVATCDALGYGECEGGASNCSIAMCIPGTCGIPGMPSPTPGTPPLPDPNSGYVLPQGLLIPIILKCLANPLCRAVLMCLAAALGAALGDLVAQLIQGTCCNWCSIGCSAICGCLALGAGIGSGGLLRPILPPPLGELIMGGIAYGACHSCCTRLLRC